METKLFLFKELFSRDENKNTKYIYNINKNL